MKPFHYGRASNVASACASAAESTTKFIAGGTNLLDLMKLQIETPTHLVDIGPLPLAQIEETADGGLRIGARVTNSILAANKRMPGSGCAALEGLNRMNAVIGVSNDCIAAHGSDMAVAMAALDARVETVAADGSARTIPIDSLYRSPGNTPHIETVLAPGELIQSVLLPPPPPGRQLYRKVRDRASYAFALVSVAVVIEREGDLVSAARVAFGGISYKPWRSAEAEAALVGAPATRASFDAAGRAALKDARGYGYNDFKIPLARRTLRTVLADATGVI